MHFRTLGLHYTFQCSSGLSDVAIGRPCDIAVRDSRNLLYVSMQCEPEDLAICLNAVPDSLTLLYFSRQFKNLEPCYTCNCSSGPSNFAIQFNIVLEYWTLLYVSKQVRILRFCHFNACQESRALPHAFDAVQDPNSAIHSNAVQDSRTSLHVPMQARTLGRCHSSNLRYSSSGLSNLATPFNAVRV